MSVRRSEYAPLPTRRSLDLDNELNAAFEDSGDESDDAQSDDDDLSNISESHPLVNNAGSRQPQPISARIQTTGTPVARTQGTYDFERVDYDVPPPGSPTRAMANDFGNTNGLIPSFDTDVDVLSQPHRSGWFRRAAASILPSHYADSLGLASRPGNRVGGGSSNDGVFANMMAKPDRRTRVRPVGNGDESIYIAPEDAQKDAPPSYSAAQADAVPSYWETTVHISSSTGAPVAGEMIIEGLPTGTLFSFLWNMLVSVSFQFVGFLLTFLLHTSHSGKLGSRAGLGITLIQFGFALRNPLEYTSDGNGGVNDGWGGWTSGEPSDPTPTFETAAEADSYFSGLNTTENNTPGETIDLSVDESSTQWLSFMLMTIGWFILLTSMMAFWRVKRWERSIISSSTPREPETPEARAREAALVDRLEDAFGLRPSNRGGNLLARGLGLSRDSNGRTQTRSAPMTEDEQRRFDEAVENDARLQNDLRSAGLL